MRKFSKLMGIIGLSVLGISLSFAAPKKDSSDHLNALYRSAGNAIAGNPQGQITMVEFFDYNCGYCRLIYPKINNLIEQNKNLRVVFREYPVLSPRSVLPAKAALAAQKQGKYAQLHEAMMTAKMPLDQSEIVRLASGLHMDTAKLLQDINSSAIDNQIEANLQIGQNMNIQGVPTFIVVRTSPPSKHPAEVVVGPSVSDLENMIKKAEND
jgi:protein-disulfide isomerase